MTISDERKQELEARGTGGSKFITATALSVALFLAQYSASLIDIAQCDFRSVGTAGTESQPLSLQFTEIDVFRQINRVYDDLLQDQVELDAESKRAIYGNLWDLYA